MSGNCLPDTHLVIAKKSISLFHHCLIDTEIAQLLVNWVSHGKITGYPNVVVKLSIITATFLRI